MADSNFKRVAAEREMAEPGRCVHHGQFVSKQVEQFDGSWLLNTCPRCRYEALRMDGVEESIRVAALAAKRSELINSLLVGSGITPRFRDCTFDSFVAAPGSREEFALRTCREYAEAFPERFKAGQSLLLLGNLGTGKTHLASAIVQHVIREFQAAAQIVTASEIARVIRASYGKGSGASEIELLKELAEFDLLVIDEVGVQSGSDFAPGLMHEIIDRRYQLIRPTVVISNQPVTELQRFLGDRAVDRLREGGGRMLSFTWASARGQE